MYALVEIKGKQYRIEKGSKLVVDLFDPQDKTVEIDKVLMLSDNENVQVGTPYLANARVILRIEGEKVGPKIRVFKYKKRKNYRLTRGHRQHYSTAVVEDIQTGL